MSPMPADMRALTPHPSVTPDAVRTVKARIVRAADGMLTLTYSVEGDISRIRVPPTRTSGRADGLWRHTCFEAFLAPQPGPAYLELNFSPSGEWAGYAFSSYRAGMSPVDTIGAPTIAVRRAEDGLTVDAAVCLESLRGDVTARVALAAVIEDASGELSYWALAHPPGKPDFHHPHGFAAQI